MRRGEPNYKLVALVFGLGILIYLGFVVGQYYVYAPLSLSPGMKADSLKSVKEPVLCKSALLSDSLEKCPTRGGSGPGLECVAPPSGMVGWWTLDNTNTDLVGGNGGIVLDDAIPWTTGKVDNAFLFSPSGGHFVVENSESLNPSSITLDAWIKSNSLSETDYSLIMIKLLENNIDEPSYLIATEPFGDSHRIVCGVRTENGYYTIDGGEGVMDNGQWVHVACTYDQSSGDIKLYINGEEDSTLLWLDENVPLASSNGNFYIGGVDSSISEDGLEFDGIIDEVEVFNRALSSNEIQSIYNADSAGKCKEDDGGVGEINPCSLCPIGILCVDDQCVFPGETCYEPPQGMVGWWPGDGDTRDLINLNHGGFFEGEYRLGKVGRSFHFYSWNDPIRIDHSEDYNFGTGPFTMDAWVKISPYYPGPRHIIGKRRESDLSNAPWTRLFLGGDDGVIVFEFGLGQSIESSPGYNDDEWHHIAGVREADGTTKLYIDGSAVAQGVNHEDVSNDADFTIGRWSHQYEYALRGDIDEVEVFNRALTPQEIWRIYYAGSAGKCKEETNQCGTIYEISDGEQYFGNPDWEWTLANLNLYASTFIDQSTALYGPIVGIQNDFVAEDHNSYVLNEPDYNDPNYYQHTEKWKSPHDYLRFEHQGINPEITTVDNYDKRIQITTKITPIDSTQVQGVPQEFQQYLSNDVNVIELNAVSEQLEPYGTPPVFMKYPYYFLGIGQSTYVEDIPNDDLYYRIRPIEVHDDFSVDFTVQKIDCRVSNPIYPNCEYTQLPEEGFTLQLSQEIEYRQNIISLYASRPYNDQNPYEREWAVVRSVREVDDNYYSDTPPASNKIYVQYFLEGNDPEMDGKALIFYEDYYTGELKFSDWGGDGASGQFYFKDIDFYAEFVNVVLDRTYPLGSPERTITFSSYIDSNINRGYRDEINLNFKADIVNGGELVTGISSLGFSEGSTEPDEVWYCDDWSYQGCQSQVQWIGDEQTDLRTRHGHIIENPSQNSLEDQFVFYVYNYKPFANIYVSKKIVTEYGYEYYNGFTENAEMGSHYFFNYPVSNAYYPTVIVPPSDPDAWNRANLDRYIVEYNGETIESYEALIFGEQSPRTVTSLTERDDSYGSNADILTGKPDSDYYTDNGMKYLAAFSTPVDLTQLSTENVLPLTFLGRDYELVGYIDDHTLQIREACPLIPALCGDGVAEGAEVCDLEDLNGQTCQSIGLGGGELGCYAPNHWLRCSFDTSECLCGNGVLDEGEECDGNIIPGACTDHGFEGGELGCTNFCEIDTSQCTQCGNGVREGIEECDDGNFVNGDGCNEQCMREYCGDNQCNFDSNTNTFETCTSCQVDCGTCSFIPETNVMTYAQDIEIQNIKEGDVVKSYNQFTGEIVPSTVKKVFVHLASEYLLINGELGVTKTHPLFINGEWRAAGVAKVGDVIKKFDGDEEIMTIVPVKERLEVYNLNVDNTHTFFAEGYLAHNKCDPSSCAGQCVDGPNGQFCCGDGICTQGECCPAQNSDCSVSGIRSWSCVV